MTTRSEASPALSASQSPLQGLAYEPDLAPDHLVTPHASTDVPLVKITSVVKKYQLDRQSVTALDGVSLSIERGDFVALSGPSGSGKSTLLNLIGCIDQPTSGAVEIEGVNVSQLRLTQLASLRRDKLGFIFQSFNLIPVFTASENVELPLILQNVPAPQRLERVKAALESVDLADRASHRPDLLSGGERQRVAVARAIVHRPALVLADEPTASLDTRTATNLLDLMMRLNEQLGITFLFSTHDQRLLDRTKRVVHLCDGSIVRAI